MLWVLKSRTKSHTEFQLIHSKYDYIVREGIVKFI